MGVLVLDLILLVVAAALGGGFASYKTCHFFKEGIRPEWRREYLRMSRDLSF